MGHLRSFILVLLVISLPGMANAQDIVSKQALVQPVYELLDQYQKRLEKINTNVSPDPTRDFVAIFSNPNVRVIDNLQNNNTTESLSVQKYCSKLKTNFPDGVIARIPNKKIKLGKIEHDLGPRYLVQVKVNMYLTAYHDGKVFENNQLQVLTIAFNWVGNAPEALRIYEISPPVFHARELWFSTSLSGSFITTPWVRQDPRFNNPIDASGGLELLYLYWLNSKIGMSTGIRASYYNSSLELDKLNPFMDNNPNLQNVSFNTSLYHMEIPVLCFYKTNFKGRLNVVAGGGLFWSQRCWITSNTTAINTNYNFTQNQIVSDQDWMNHIRQSFMGAEIHAGLRMKISQSVNLSLDTRFLQGLSSLDKDEDARFETERYTGQYNPLWMDPVSHNYLQALSIRIGVTLLLNNQNE